ncbi:bifunctional glutamate N-acetyltransferase/amino-acid acetyltransferase ArgJ [Salibacterium halotolerans]|uniref:Arginine biosynthesis bifunctional protein ArgJ n=1 Tax=Salibacterium halotolerans TaxID=1884432 RepID=A0A1I5T7K9_9BACI|nr:bifunctional glutamate N-acetyltransferase/amino-acid acetyltransferase ArgJ [Salibacterium halotolerans]SFP79022.1 glutamate N-acetyltransferase / amino-acid N-acetyltransferase [Salibacterium halotolerans]
MGTVYKTENITEVSGGSIITPKGFKAAGIHTQVKRKRNDLGAILCDVPASSAAVYTLNKIQAAPLQVTKESIAEEGKLRAVVINSGNANACTGEEGLQDAYTMRRTAAETFQIPLHQVAVNSTGVIGERLAMDKIVPGIQELDPMPAFKDADQFNEAIMTTDTVKKHACFQTTVDDKQVTFGGAAKGSGMIHPNMATMLGFVTTDAVIEPEHLQRALSEVTNKTFNCITVDGDTSTNDNVVVMASGHAGNEPLTPSHPEWDTFIHSLQTTCEELARKIARDGEGATKLVEVKVDGALNDHEAAKAAKQIVGSDLVKTAIYGTDANWGRIIVALGYSGVELDPEAIDISLGPVTTLKNSRPVSFSEEEAKAYLENEEITIQVDLHTGHGSGKAWGCDLSYEYVRINAGYRT